MNGKADNSSNNPQGETAEPAPSECGVEVGTSQRDPRPWTNYIDDVSGSIATILFFVAGGFATAGHIRIGLWFGYMVCVLIAVCLIANWHERSILPYCLESWPVRFVMLTATVLLFVFLYLDHAIATNARAETTKERGRDAKIDAIEGTTKELDSRFDERFPRKAPPITPGTKPEPGPRNSKGEPTDGIIVMLGSNALTLSGPGNLMTYKGEPILSVARAKDDEEGIFLSATIFDDAGQVVCKVINNEVLANPNAVFYLKRSPHRISVMDYRDRPVLEIEYLNPHAFQLWGDFYVRGGSHFKIDDDRLIIDGTFHLRRNVRANAPWELSQGF